MDTNKARVKRIKRIGKVYASLAGMKQTDDNYEPTLVRDMLSDLMHYCNKYAVHFEQELIAARQNYRCEVAEEQPCEPQ